MGPDGEREVVGDICLRDLLRALLHRPRRSAAVADQRATISADPADQSRSEWSQFLRSLQRQPSGAEHVRQATDQLDADSKPASALFAGLGPERSKVVQR